MGFSFRKSFKAGPIRINLSKSGIGASFGVKGARISTGPRGTHLNVGAKGVYYRQKIGGAPGPQTQAQDPQPPAYPPSLATAPPKKRRWPIYVGALVVLGAIGNLIEKPKPTYTPSYQSPVAEASPFPTSSPAQRAAKQNRGTKAVRTTQPTDASNQSTDPVIISQAPKTSMPPQVPPRQASALSSVPASETYSPRAISGRSSAGRMYILGPRGGCYYISGSGSKVYVERSLCD